jgi:hypothetical protein
MVVIPLVRMSMNGVGMRCHCTEGTQPVAVFYDFFVVFRFHGDLPVRFCVSASSYEVPVLVFLLFRSRYCHHDGCNELFQLSFTGYP